jgi:hypothetical protein
MPLLHAAQRGLLARFYEREQIFSTDVATYPGAVEYAVGGEAIDPLLIVAFVESMSVT